MSSKITSIAGVRDVGTSKRDAIQTLHLVQLAGLLLVGFAIRLAFIQAAGYRDDMTIFYSWFKGISLLPPAQVYTHVPNLNYPPGFVVIIELSAWIQRFFVAGIPTEYALNIALKLPPILFDLIGAAAVYAIIRRDASHLYALAGAAFIALNPAIIYDSAYWGQDDSIPTVLALLAIYALRSSNPIVAWLTLTFAVLVKPPVLLLYPLLLIYPLTVPQSTRRSMFWQTGVGVIAAVALTLVLAVTYFPHPSLFGAVKSFAIALKGDAGYFPMTSLNAFNLWALFAPFFTPDKTPFLLVSLKYWGYLLFCTAAALIYGRYASRRSTTALFEAATLVLLAFFILLTEIHERYQYYAVVFIAVLVFKKSYRNAALILTLTLLLSLEYGLTFMYLDDARATMIDRYEFAPWLIHLCSIANIGVFFWLLVDYLGLRRPPNMWTKWLAEGSGAGNSRARKRERVEG